MLFRSEVKFFLFPSDYFNEILRSLFCYLPVSYTHLEGERTHDAGMDGLVEIILPPQMAGVIVAVIERWGFSMEESIRCV